MFGSDILDVAIGVTLLFLFVSLICSAIQEAIEAALKWRAMDLERGIREILQAHAGKPQADTSPKTGSTQDNSISADTSVVQALYGHPFIYSLFPGTYNAAALKTGGWRSGAWGHLIMPWSARRNLPAYIPSQNFAAALIDLIRQAAGSDAPLTIEKLQEGAGKIENPRLKAAVLAAIADADGKVDRLRKMFETWYDGTMDRVSGWYKRRTQTLLLLIGFAVAILFNIDAVHVTRHLVNDKAYRDAVVAQAERVNEAQTKAQEEAAKTKAATPPAGNPAPSGAGNAQPGQEIPKQTTPTASGGTAPASGSSPTEFERAKAKAAQFHTELSANGFLLGWPPQQLADARAEGRSVVAAAVFMFLGWAITGLAVSFGAPFWFDVLNKFMVVRSTVKPAEKSGREASKDSGGEADDPAAGKRVPVTLLLQPLPPGGSKTDGQ